VGETFGRYEVIKRIGRGGMAEVFLARFAPAPGVTKDVVVKRILPAYADLPEFRSMFLAEARLSMRLSHGNVVQVFDVGDVDDSLFLAMELVDGVALDAVMERAQKQGLIGLPPVVAAQIVIEMLKGLHHAHTRKGEDGQSLGLVHRDVSPDNVLVSYDGEVKVTDFGIAKAAMAGRELTRPGIFKGKFTYGAPEQARGEKVDARADVYATGIVLYELIAGSNPSGPTEVAKEVGSGARMLPRFPVTLADPEFVNVISRAVSPNPHERYASAQQFQQALLQWTALRAGVHAATGIANTMRWLFAEELRARNPGEPLQPVPEVFIELMQSRKKRRNDQPTRDGLPAFATATNEVPDLKPVKPEVEPGLTSKQVSAIGVAVSALLLGVAMWIWLQDRSTEAAEEAARLELAKQLRPSPGPPKPEPAGPLQPQKPPPDQVEDLPDAPAPAPSVFLLHGAPSLVTLGAAHTLLVDGAPFVDWGPGASLKVIETPRLALGDSGPLFALQRVNERAAVTQLEGGKVESLVGVKGTVQLFAVTPFSPMANNASFTAGRVMTSGKQVPLARTAMQLVHKENCVTIDELSPRKTYRLDVSAAKKDAPASPVVAMVQGEVAGRAQVDGNYGSSVLQPGEHIVTNARAVFLVVPTVSGAQRSDMVVKLTAVEEGGRPAKKGAVAPVVSEGPASMMSSSVVEAKPHFERANKALAGGQTAEAREALLKGLRADPKNVGGHYWAGVLAQRQNDTSDALFQFRVFLKLAPESHPNRKEVTRLLATLEKSD
jgi:serine/threonine protein kinase